MSRPESWRLIDEPPGAADYNMAMDEALALSAAGNPHSAPTLRLYGWARPSVSMGRFQRISDIDEQYCASKGIHIVRRPTGGRAILHVADELTYGFTAPTVEGIFSGGLFESYALLSRAFMIAFRPLGIPCESEGRKRTGRARSGVCFESASFAELSANGRKLIGSAQRRLTGAMLQQGAIPLELDYEGMGRVFGAGDADALKTSMAGLHEFEPSLTLSELRDALLEGFQKAFGVRFEPGPPTRHEAELAERLRRERYSDPLWLRGRDGNRPAPRP